MKRTDEQKILQEAVDDVFSCLHIYSFFLFVVLPVLFSFCFHDISVVEELEKAKKCQCLKAN